MRKSAVLIGAAAIVASMALMGTASAVPIDTSFDFIQSGTLTADNASITAATSITSGAPLQVTVIKTDNTGLVLTQAVGLSAMLPLTVGGTFQKSWTTALGTFTADLTVNSTTPSATSLGIQASGTVTETTVISGPALSPARDFYSAQYNQGFGAGTPITGTFNNSTLPLAAPEPTSLPLLAVGLAGLGIVLRTRRA